jgi:S-DNA-T family DNA segregation ATPase FtsK/SpoIIIE
VLVIDGGDDAQWQEFAAHPACAGVVRLHERERLWRLLQRVAQQGPGATVRPHLVIDGLAALRHELDAVDRSTELELLDRIVSDGGVTLLVGADRVAAVPPSIVSRCAVRVVLHLHDRHDAASLGVAAASVAPRIAGRAVIGATATAVQMIAPQPLRGLGRRRRRAVAIGSLPTHVSAADLPTPHHDQSSWHVAIGIGFQHLAPLVLEVVDGEHMLIAGSARTGRSSALARLCSGWLDSAAEAHVVVIAGRRSPLSGWLGASEGRVDTHDRTEPALDAVLAAIAEGRRVMLAVDDAEMVDDVGGRLAAMIAERTSGLTVVAAGRPDALRQSYGHWTLAVRRSRLGLLSSNAQDVDGDLLGATLPRRAMLAPRPGLFHLVEGGNVELVQLAMPDAAAAPPVARVS